MQPWQRVWQAAKGLISTKALTALRRALESDDARLIQERTTYPTALLENYRSRCEGACLLGFCGMAEGLTTVEEVERFFADLVVRLDVEMGEPAAARWLLGYWDETPRAEAFCALLAEVDRELIERGEKS